MPNELLNTLIAGSFSGCASVLACHPLDVLRIKLQTERTKAGAGSTALSLLKDIVRVEGWSALYRGFWAPFFAQAVYKSVIFSTNSFVSSNVFTGQRTSFSIFSSGLIAGLVNSVIVSPVELVRTRQVLSLPLDKLPVHACIRQFLAEPQGARGLWRGLGPTMLRDGPGIGFYLLAFEFCKGALHSPSIATDSTANANTRPTSTTSIPLTTRIVSASCAGIAFWLWALPVDTIKTWIEANVHTSGRSKGISTGSLSVLSEFASESTRGQLVRQLFRAWPVAFARGVPSAIVTLTTYGLAMDMLEKRE